MQKGRNPEKNRTRARLDLLRIELGDMQRRAFDLNIPIVVVFDGLDAWGLAENVNQFVRTLDPRGCDVHSLDRPIEAERELPFISRFYVKMPSRGRIAIFDRSWYFWLLYDYYRSGDKKRAQRRMHEVCMMENQHVKEGWIILKFFFDVKKKELRRRGDEFDLRDPCRGEFHLAGDEFVKDYDDVIDLWREVLKDNDTPCAPWHWIGADDVEKATVEVIEKVLEVMGPVYEGDLSTCRAGLENKLLPELTGPTVLDQVDLTQNIPENEYKASLERLQLKLDSMQCECYKKRVPTLIVFEGWDAAGKGGNILRLTAPLNPRGYEVVPVAAPSDEERSHHHLWRFFKHFPRDGRMTIFDRSWYGRVLVERVEGLISEEEWNWAYEEINEMEKMLVDHGTTIVKFWLHIDKQEQERRFKEREADPHKQWKITPDDYRNRGSWDLYLPAVEEMIARTSTKKAPWMVVPSNDKRFARIFVLQKIIEAMEHGLKER